MVGWDTRHYSGIEALLLLLAMAITVNLVG